MEKEPVEQGRGKHLVPEQRAPLGKAGVGSQDGRSVLIARRHQLKEIAGLFL